MNINDYLTSTLSEEFNSTLNLEKKSTIEQKKQDCGSEQGELNTFLLNCINHPKDRIILLRLDKELGVFIKDKVKTSIAFPKLNNYQRLIIHKVADYFGLAHATKDGRIILHKSSSTKIPLIRFLDLSTTVPEVTQNNEFTPAPKLKIMKRPRSIPSTITAEEPSKQPDLIQNKKIVNEIKILAPIRRTKTNTLSEIKERVIQEPLIVKGKTIEERELEYQKARERIFTKDEVDELDSDEPANVFNTPIYGNLHEHYDTQAYTRNIYTQPHNYYNQDAPFDYSYDGYSNLQTVQHNDYMNEDTKLNQSTGEDFPSLSFSGQNSSKYDPFSWKSTLNTATIPCKVDGDLGMIDPSQISPFVPSFGNDQEIKKALYDPNVNLKPISSKEADKPKNVNEIDQKPIFDYTGNGVYDGVKPDSVPDLPTHILQLISKGDQHLTDLLKMDGKKIRKYLNLTSEFGKAKVKVDPTYKNGVKLIIIFCDQKLASNYSASFGTLSSQFKINVWNPLI